MKAGYEMETSIYQFPERKHLSLLCTAPVEACLQMYKSSSSLTL